jgi:hypothetical protein
VTESAAASGGFTVLDWHGSQGIPPFPSRELLPGFKKCSDNANS